MFFLGMDEEELLMELCEEHEVKSEYFRVLIALKKESNYKSLAKNNEFRKELDDKTKTWAQEYSEED